MLLKEFVELNKGLDFFVCPKFVQVRRGGRRRGSVQGPTPQVHRRCGKVLETSSSWMNRPTGLWVFCELDAKDDRARIRT